MFHLWDHLWVSQMARGPFADMTLIYNHQGWVLHPRLSTELILLLSLSFSLSFSLSLPLSPSLWHTHTHMYTQKLWPCALYLATLGTEWHHTSPQSNSMVRGINGRLMLKDLAAVHKGACLSLLIYRHNPHSIISSSLHSHVWIQLEIKTLFE